MLMHVFVILCQDSEFRGIHTNLSENISYDDCMMIRRKIISTVVCFMNFNKIAGLLSIFT